MLKRDMVNKIHAEMNKKITKNDIDCVVNCMLRVIRDELINGGEVKLTWFGTFSTKKRPARTGHNPRTGESVHIASRTVPTFKARKELKDAINGV